MPCAIFRVYASVAYLHHNHSWHDFVLSSSNALAATRGHLAFAQDFDGADGSMRFVKHPAFGLVRMCDVSGYGMGSARSLARDGARYQRHISVDSCDQLLLDHGRRQDVVFPAALAVPLNIGALNGYRLACTVIAKASRGCPGLGVVLNSNRRVNNISTAGPHSQVRPGRAGKSDAASERTRS